MTRQNRTEGTCIANFEKSRCFYGIQNLINWFTKRKQTLVFYYFKIISNTLIVCCVQNVLINQYTNGRYSFHL